MTENTDRRVIFLDTQVFERLRHNYQHQKLQTIAELAAEGHIAIILTTITVGEIHSHIDEQVKAACSHLRKCIAEHVILQHIKTPLLTDSTQRLYETVRTELHESFQNFLQAGSVLVVSSEGVNIEDILKSYFEHKQPFGEARSKEGFPDAIAAAALEQWANREKQQVEVVTANLKHWEPMCEHSQWLRYAGELAKVLESLQDKTLVIRLRKAVNSQLPLFTPHISSAFSDLIFDLVYYEDHTEGDLEDVVVDEVEVLDWHITSVRNDRATLDFLCNVSFQAEASFEDPQSGIWDSEDHVWLFREHKSGTISGEKSLSCEVTITFDQANPEAIEVDGVTFGLSRVVDVDVSGVE